MEVKARPLISEVRPLNQNQTQERRVSWNQDMDQTHSLQDQVPEQTSLDQTAPSVGEEENSEQRPSPLKKKVQVESRRNQGPVARAAASHLNSSSGLRKAQSVQSLLTDVGKNETQEVSPDGQCGGGDSTLTPRSVGERGIRWPLQMFNIVNIVFLSYR